VLIAKLLSMQDTPSFNMDFSTGMASYVRKAMEKLADRDTPLEEKWKCESIQNKVSRWARRDSNPLVGKACLRLADVDRCILR